uniref:Protein suppressor of variegation 3-7 n=1 Tax=Caenorhabditis tropicalis TaxID=1561998 RepID=A0A1I7TZT6_9PELO
MVLMVVYNYYGREMRAAYRRFLVFREEFLVFSRAYRHELLDAGDSLASEDKEVKVAPPSSQYQNVAADDNQSEWDFGSSDDDYETDLDDERFSDLARAIAEHERRQAEVDRMREQIRITETIEFDEYLLAKGLIDESEFGKTLMVEI